jgi:hypothetical protein
MLFLLILEAALEVAVILAIADGAMGRSQALGFFRRACCCDAFIMTTIGFDFGISPCWFTSSLPVIELLHNRNKGCLFVRIVE